MEERPRQPGLRCRSETEPAEDRRHGRGRQAALGHGDLPEGRHGDCREPRRRQPVGVGDQRQERRKGDRHGLGRRTGDQVSAVAITPDGKRALAAKSNANKIALLTIDGGKVTYDKRDLPVGVYPYNLGVTPDGKLALTADNGAGGGSDGNVDMVSVIDLEANPARVIDHVVIGDAPEGFAISPKGNLAVAVLLQGTNAEKSAFYYHPNGAAVALKIDGKKVTKTGEVPVGGLPEGIVFSPNGDYVYIGNFTDQDVSILKVDGDRLTDTGQKLKLPGHPASMRAGPPQSERRAERRSAFRADARNGGLHPLSPNHRLGSARRQARAAASMMASASIPYSR